MLFFKTDVRESGLEGKGLFARETIPKGKVVACHIWPSSIVMPEAALQGFCGNGYESILSTGIRLWPNIFLANKPHEPFGNTPTGYINHSFKPNLLFAFGWSISLEEILPNVELTLDYRLWLTPVDSEGKPLVVFNDRKTGKPVRGDIDLMAMCQQVNQLHDLMVDLHSF